MINNGDFPVPVKVRLILCFRSCVLCGCYKDTLEAAFVKDPASSHSKNKMEFMESKCTSALLTNMVRKWQD